MSWLKKIAGVVSGATAREQEAAIASILAEHEARPNFDRGVVLRDLQGIAPHQQANAALNRHMANAVRQVVDEVLSDGLVTPEEESRIESTVRRYGGRILAPALQERVDRAKSQYLAWTMPLAPIEAPLLLKKGEWCAHAVAASASEERQRTVRTNYSGPSVRVRIAKGVYYNASSVRAERQTEAFQHTFGEGVLAATNTRVLWISPQKTISIPLSKIIQFTPYSDGIKVFRDTGKPLLFSFSDGEDQASMVRLSRVIEELR